MKSYARDPYYEKLDSDRGILLDYYYGDSRHKIPLKNEICILALFVILNLLFLTFTAFYSKSIAQLITERAYFKKIMEKYYWSTGALFGLLNSLWFLIVIYQFLLEFYDTVQFFVIIVLFIVVPINAGLATRHITIPVPGIFKIICCCCCCFRCCSKKYMARCIHTLSLSHILWFMHRLISTSIVVICYFVVAPAQVLAVVSLFFSSIICIILFSSVIFSSCAYSCKCFVRFIGLVFLLLQTLAVIILFTLFYINLADKGLESDGIGGIFLSLIPPATFFIVGLIAERRLFNKTRKPSGNEDRNVEENNFKDQVESPIRMIAGGGIQSTDQPSVHQCNNIDENTHLLPRQ